MKMTAAILVAFIASALIAPLQINADQLDDMRFAVQHSSPSEFVEGIGSNQWTVPHIHSKWYVDRTASGEMKERLERTRVWGRLFAERVDSWSETIRSVDRSSEVASLSSALLSLSDWLAASNGYGNTILAYRCLDVASVGIARLAVDTNYPFDLVSGMVARLTAPWQSSRARATLLNSEAQSNVFDASGVDPTIIQVRMSATWQEGRKHVLAREIREHPGGRLAKGRIQGYRAVEDSPRSADQTKLAGIAVASVGMEDFFADTPAALLPARPWTTTRLWDIKQHGFFVGGDLTSPNAIALKQLLRFRHEVGRFPDRLIMTREQIEAQEAEIKDAAKRGIRVVPLQRAFGSEREAAFDAAWNGIGRAEHTVGRMACQTYEAVLAKTFLDADTKELRLANRLGLGGGGVVP